MSAGRLRVALVEHTVSNDAARRTARALVADGCEARVISSHPRPTRASLEDGVEVVRVARLPEAPLRYRGFTGPITHAPLALRALARDEYDVVHAFSPEDAAIALRSRHATGAPVVFTAAEPLTRDRLADRRLRLRFVQAAVEGSDALTATTDEFAELAARWLAVDAQVIDPADAAAHERLYRELVARRRR